MWKPELLAPAKNLERLKVAITYGADAVYVGGQRYGLRARADNFNDDELVEAVNYAHAHGAKLYVTLNAFLHDEDFEGLVEFCRFLDFIGVDAVIVSDLGVLRVVKRSCNIDVHLSTQASCLNSYAAKLWHRLGATRLIVGRELTIAEGGQIHRNTGLEVEMFTHGAMCMAYSGHCTISNFTAGRDSNRGGCIQSCRFPYQLDQKQPNFISVDDLLSNSLSTKQATTTFMSSRDLWGIYQVPDFFENRVCSLKIEGRMKSSFYVATACKAYRTVIDACAEGRLSDDLLEQVATELRAMPNRSYDTGSLDQPAGPESVFGQLSGINEGRNRYLGIVLDTTPDKLFMRLIEPLAVGDEIELVPPSQPPIRWTVDQLYTVTGKPLHHMRKDSVVCLPRHNFFQPISKLNVARMRV